MWRPWGRLAVLLLASLPWHGAATAAECMKNDGNALVDKLGNNVRYRFVPHDRRWEVFPFGWHATAQISCEKCNSQGEIGAYAWLSAGDGEGLASEDDTQFMTLISSMWFSGYQGEPPTAEGEQEPIRWHAFSGYARRFVGVGKDGEKHMLIGARLTDGCAHVRLYTAVGQIKAPTASAYLQPMLNGVRVERH